MAIQNIHILIDHPVSAVGLTPAQTALIQMRISEHRKGQHTYGNMRRDCPLCK